MYGDVCKLFVCGVCSLLSPPVVCANNEESDAVESVSRKAGPRKGPCPGVLVVVRCLKVDCPWAGEETQMSRKGMDAGQRRRCACCVGK